MKEERAHGQTEGRTEIVDAVRRKILAPRGISRISDQEILDALLEREDRTDFWKRLNSAQR